MGWQSIEDVIPSVRDEPVRPWERTAPARRTLPQRGPLSEEARKRISEGQRRRYQREREERSA